MASFVRWSCGVAVGVALVAANAQTQDIDTPQRREPHGWPGLTRSPIVMVRAREAFEEKVVKGVPYSAATETEIVQILSDGNRIRHKSVGFVARDSDGRTRSEQSLAAIGAILGGPEAPRIVSIHDPVDHVAYVLEEDTKTARRMPIPDDMGKIDRPGFRLPRPEMVPNAAESAKSLQRSEESLGSQVIEGLNAEGTRQTLTVPEEAWGNERPIEIVTERWYSPELQATLKTENKDPRFGETRYHLASINRSEPDKALFRVPSDYTVQDGPRRPSGRLHGQEERRP